MSDHIPDAGKKVREDFEAWAASAAEAMKQAHTHLMFAAACNGVTVLDSVGVQETCEALHEAIEGMKPIQAATQHSAARIAELEAEANVCGSGAGCLYKDARIEALEAERDAIAELNHAQWLALENVRHLAARNRKEEWAQHLLRFVEQAGTNKAQIMRKQVDTAIESERAKS